MDEQVINLKDAFFVYFGIIAIFLLSIFYIGNYYINDSNELNDCKNAVSYYQNNYLNTQKDYEKLKEQYGEIPAFFSKNYSNVSTYSNNYTLINCTYFRIEFNKIDYCNIEGTTNKGVGIGGINLGTDELGNNEMAIDKSYELRSNKFWFVYYHERCHSQFKSTFYSQAEELLCDNVADMYVRQNESLVIYYWDD